MGILNITPDSFYPESRVIGEKKALQKAEQMLDEGADILDIGAYSSRPGASVVSPEEEMNRLLPVIRSVSKHFPDAILSADTFRASIAHAAVQEGACIINDISGGQADPDMYSTVAGLQVPYILMHMKGTPQTMQEETHYKDLMGDILIYFMERLNLLAEAGVKDVIADPGFGFAKNISQNFLLLQQLAQLNILGVPVLAGLSRKSMIYKTLHIQVDDALNGTTSMHTAALLNGADILRVHDVKEAVQVARLLNQLKKSSSFQP